jgi:GABA permease
MRRYLVVAHQTLASRELLEAMKAKSAEEDTAFYLLVPIHHGEPGLTWTEGHDRAVAQRRLSEAQLRMTAEGVTVAGEVGGDSPVDSVDEVLRREGSGTFAGIIVSTLPRNVSKWLKVDVPSRIQRKTALPVDHLIGHPVVAHRLARHARSTRSRQHVASGPAIGGANGGKANTATGRP